MRLRLPTMEPFETSVNGTQWHSTRALTQWHSVAISGTQWHLPADDYAIQAPRWHPHLWGGAVVSTCMLEERHVGIHTYAKVILHRNRY